jgi:hypothetical protein
MYDHGAMLYEPAIGRRNNIGKRIATLLSFDIEYPSLSVKPLVYCCKRQNVFKLASIKQNSVCKLLMSCKK